MSATRGENVSGKPRLPLHEPFTFLDHSRLISDQSGHVSPDCLLLTGAGNATLLNGGDMHEKKLSGRGLFWREFSFKDLAFFLSFLLSTQLLNLNYSTFFFFLYQMYYIVVNIGSILGIRSALALD